MRTNKSPLLAGLLKATLRLECYWWSGNIPNGMVAVIVCGSVLLVAVLFAIFIYIRLTRLVKNKAGIDKEEVAFLQRNLGHTLKLLGLSFFIIFASIPAAEILIDLVYKFFAYSICDTEETLLRIFVTSVFGVFAYLVWDHLALRDEASLKNKS